MYYICFSECSLSKKKFTIHFQGSKVSTYRFSEKKNGPFRTDPKLPPIIPPNQKSRPGAHRQWEIPKKGTMLDKQKDMNHLPTMDSLDDIISFQESLQKKMEGLKNWC